MGAFELPEMNLTRDKLLSHQIFCLVQGRRRPLSQQLVDQESTKSLLTLTQSKVQRKSGTRYHQGILLYWE